MKKICLKQPLLFLAACLLTAPGIGHTRAANTVVHITNFSFDPSTVTINPGDSITWMQDDGGTAHTTTSGVPPTPDGKWDSGFMNQGNSFSQTFNTVGTFPYFCQVHNFMTAAVVVQAAQSTPPTVSITSPTNNSVFNSITNITIAASATGNGATIAKVEFFDGTTSLGNANSSPYSVTATLGVGAHSLTAKATDSNAASAVSSPVGVTVNTGGTRITDPIPAKIAKSDVTIELETVLDGLVSPLGTAVPDDNSGRIFVYDQIGLGYVLKDGHKLDAPLIDVQSRLVPLGPAYDERGFLGLATHPNFSQNPFIYTYTSEPNGPMADFMIMYPDATPNDHQSVIAEWRMDPNNPDRVDPASRREILRIDKPESNHNAGTLRFGPDGFLYFTVGDGGQADDQGPGHSVGGNGQDKSKILGKISRIDVDARTSANGQYGVPSDNPFTGPGVVSEIYAYGMRNPYNFSFDRSTGELYLGDVGQNQVEELDRVSKGGNYGWPIKEGGFYFDPNGTGDGFVTTLPVREVPADLIDPIAQYDHDEGEAIVGGFVYRGTNIPALSGRYIGGDWGVFGKPAGRLFVLDGSDFKELRIGSQDRALGLWLKGFGQDTNGEMYVFGSTNQGPTGTSGKMLKIVPVATALPAFSTYIEQDLVSDIPGRAAVTDTNLVNPWGIAFSPTSPFWLNDNHTGLSTLYRGDGTIAPVVVAIPPPTGGTPPSAPTGMVFNNTTNFPVVQGTNSRFIFATEDGTISAWAAGSNAVLKVDNSGTDTIYKGLALASAGGTNRLYASDFHNGKIDIFDANFQPVTLTNAFQDSSLPAGYAPFNIQNLNGNLYVTYALQDDDAEDDVGGPGNGFVNIFGANGVFVKRLITAGALNSPWGLALAPTSFGQFGGALLVGNFGDGLINAFDPATGARLGSLVGTNGSPLSIQGLWALSFGNGAQGFDVSKLYFTAGIPGDGSVEDHGLFGSIAAGSGILITRIEASSSQLTISWAGAAGPYILQKKSSLGDAAWTDVIPATSTNTVQIPMEGLTGFLRVQGVGTP